MPSEQTPPEGGTAEAQLDYDRVEQIIDVIQDDLGELQDEIPGGFKEDVEDVKERVEDIEDAVDDAQDDEGDNPLGPVPAQIDYLQKTVDNLEEQVGGVSTSDVQEGLEALEEAFEGVAIDQTAWFAEVDDVPEVYQTQVVDAVQLKQQGDVQGNTEQFTVKAVPSSSADLSEAIANFPDDGNEVDLEEFTYFLTEKAEGGVV